MNTFDLWNDRDVAIHEAIAEHGRGNFAREYAKKTLAEWAVYCSAKPDSWEVPRFDERRFKPPPSLDDRPLCKSCYATGWVYVGQGHVERCTCRPDTRKPPKTKESKQLPSREVPLLPAPEPPKVEVTE
jgi:hypothetical protein